MSLCWNRKSLVEFWMLMPSCGVSLVAWVHQSKSGKWWTSPRCGSLSTGQNAFKHKLAPKLKSISLKNWAFVQCIVKDDSTRFTKLMTPVHSYSGSSSCSIIKALSSDDGLCQPMILVVIFISKKTHFWVQGMLSLGLVFFSHPFQIWAHLL